MDRWSKAKHGTNSGYNLHRHYGETPCDECKQAHNEYNYSRNQSFDKITPYQQSRRVKPTESIIIRFCKNCGMQTKGERVFCNECRILTLKFKMDKDSPCVYCGNRANSIDHILPRILGGTNDESNLVPACMSCNTSKRDKLLIEWDRIKVTHAITISVKVRVEWNRQIGVASDGTRMVH